MMTGPNRGDTYEDADGNVWAFDPPYDDDPVPDYGDDSPPERTW